MSPITYPRPRPFLIILLVGLISTPLLAHKADQSYLYLRIYEDAIEGTFQMHLSDLSAALDLDLQQGMTEADLAPYLPQIHAYLKERTDFTSQYGEHEIEFIPGEMKFLDLNIGYIGGFPFRLSNVTRIPDKIDIRFAVIYDVLPTHRSFVLQQYNWKAGIHDNEAMISLSYGLGNDGPHTLDLTKANVWNGFLAMVKSGMYHIYIGLDHILFLVALLLPAVVYRPRRKVLGATGTVSLPREQSRSRWLPVEKFRPAFVYVLKIVTYFTIAHTITLSLAALGVVQLPGRFVEATIALSIALAALHNIRPLFKNETMAIAFGFGLFHGFGFASVLSEVGLRGEYMVLSLLGFNLGVELAQILIICAVFPVLYFLRRFKIYRYILLLGSIGLIVIAMYWFIERAFEIDIKVVDPIKDVLRAIGLMS